MNGIYQKKFNNWEEFSNHTLDWFSTDTKENYEKNMTVNSHDLTLFNWHTKKVSYTFNSHGFRCDEFKPDSILFLGCSITQGIGMPIEEIFPTLISKQLGYNCINLGITCSSANTSFRLASYWLEKLKPKIVVSLLLYPHRYELLTAEQAIHFIPNHKFQNKDSYTSKFYTEFYENWILQTENCQLNYDKNILAIDQLCTNYNIKYVNATDVFDVWKLQKLVSSDKSRARDLVHPGVATHQIIADELLKVL